MNKFTKKYICFYNSYFYPRGLETNDKYLRGAW